MTDAASAPHSAREILARYKAVFGAAWQARHELAGPKRLADETAFLPAALALQETRCTRRRGAPPLPCALSSPWPCSGPVSARSTSSPARGAPLALMRIPLAPYPMPVTIFQQGRPAKHYLAAESSAAVCSLI